MQRSDHQRRCISRGVIAPARAARGFTAPARAARGFTPLTRAARGFTPLTRAARGFTPLTRAARGFTVIEVVIVITIVGIVAAIVARFIVAPVQGYLDTQARASLVDQGDLALRRIGRDLRVALPNSTRVAASGLALELIPTTGAARYVAEGANRLQVGTLATSFDVIGPPLMLGAAQQLVFYNLGTGIVGSDAYADNTSAAAQASSNRRTATNAAGPAGTITMASQAGLPVAAFAPPYRVFAAEQPITYRCDLSAGTLTRHAGYGFVATQADPPSGGTGAVLARGVSACRFGYDGAVIASRAALVTLALSLRSGSGPSAETVNLHHAVHVDNLP